MSEKNLETFFRCVYDYSKPCVEGQTNHGVKSRYLNVPVELKKTKFRNKKLKSLLLDITDIVSTRYRLSPLDDLTDSECESIDSNSSYQGPRARMRANAELEEIAHQKNLTALKSSDWIIQKFSDALNTGDWPENDAAKERKLVRPLKLSNYAKRILKANLWR